MSEEVSLMHSLQSHLIQSTFIPDLSFYVPVDKSEEDYAVLICVRGQRVAV